MTSRDPIAALATHTVTNQPPPLENLNLFDVDAPLQEALHREGAGWAEGQVRAMGEEAGSEQAQQWGREADRNDPELHSFDRFGQRIDEVTFHPAYHELMAMAMRHGIHAVAWTAPQSGGHVLHTALDYLFIQVEQGVACPMAMTYAAVPPLRRQPELAAEWEPRIFSRTYDPRCIPAAEKRGATIGMAMTEKQGGSDVRTNTTRAVPLGAGGPGRRPVPCASPASWRPPPPGPGRPTHCASAAAGSVGGKRPCGEPHGESPATGPGASCPPGPGPCRAACAAPCR